MRCVVLVAALLLVPAITAAQVAVDDAAVPRTPWGTPDLNGVWDYRNVVPLQRTDLFGLDGQEFLTEEQAAALPERRLEAADAGGRFGRPVHPIWWLDIGRDVTLDRRAWLLIDPPGGTLPPLTAAARQAQGSRHRPMRDRVTAGSHAHGPEDLGLSERCLLGYSTGPPLLPHAYNNNIQFFVTPAYVVLYTEMIHDARIVPIDGRAHLQPSVRQWNGDSRGHWEGDRLVVTTTNFTDKTASFTTPRLVGLGTGESMQLVERFTPIDGDTLRYEFTVTDAETFTRPFTVAFPMRRGDQPIYEYACHEGNYAMRGSLRGARAEERALAGTAAEELK